MSFCTKTCSSNFLLIHTNQSIFRLNTCAAGFRGHYLSWLEGLRTRALTVPLTAVPTVVLDGQINNMAVHDLRGQICDALGDVKPSECN